MVSNIGDIILRQSSEIIPKYYAIRDYLVSDNCVIEGRMRDFCQQLVHIGLFVNYFYSLYLVSMRGALSSENNCERNANLKYVNAYIIEGYKALWGYKRQNKSLWGKLIRLHSEIKDTDEYDKILDEITSSLKEYANIAIIDKSERDLAMHYQVEVQGNPQDLVKLDNITLGEELNKYEQFTPIYYKVIGCLPDMINHYLVEPYRQEIYQVATCLPTLDSMDQFFWANKLSEVSFALNRNIASYTKAFERYKEIISKYQNVFEKIKKQYDVELDDCKEMLQMTDVMLATSYFSLDVCSALKIYFNSELPIERKIALARVNIICHSIIDRIYGYAERKGSYWERYITKPFVDSQFTDNVKEIESTMESLIASNIYTPQKRTSFAHLDECNFLTAIDYIYESNPIIEVLNSQKIIKILPKVQQAVMDGCLQCDTNHKQKIAWKYTWVDECMGKMEAYRNQPEINVVYESFRKLKEGDILGFFENMHRC